MYDGVHVDSIHADQSAAARQAAVDNFRRAAPWLVLRCAALRHFLPAALAARARAWAMRGRM